MGGYSSASRAAELADLPSHPEAAPGHTDCDGPDDYPIDVRGAVSAIVGEWEEEKKYFLKKNSRMCGGWVLPQYASHWQRNAVLSKS